MRAVDFKSHRDATPAEAGQVERVAERRCHLLYRLEPQSPQRLADGALRGGGRGAAARKRRGAPGEGRGLGPGSGLGPGQGPGSGPGSGPGRAAAASEERGAPPGEVRRERRPAVACGGALGAPKLPLVQLVDAQRVAADDRVAARGEARALVEVVRGRVGGRGRVRYRAKLSSARRSPVHEGGWVWCRAEQRAAKPGPRRRLGMVPS